MVRNVKKNRIEKKYDGNMKKKLGCLTKLIIVIFLKSNYYLTL